jgi:predicted AAA+ superfamily ATPase
VTGSIPRIRFGEQIVMSPTFIHILPTILEQLRTDNTYFVVVVDSLRGFGTIYRSLGSS